MCRMLIKPGASDTEHPAGDWRCHSNESAPAWWHITSAWRVPSIFSLQKRLSLQLKSRHGKVALIFSQQEMQPRCYMCRKLGKIISFWTLTSESNRWYFNTIRITRLLPNHYWGWIWKGRYLNGAEIWLPPSLAYISFFIFLSGQCCKLSLISSIFASIKRAIWWWVYNS